MHKAFLVLGLMLPVFSMQAQDTQSWYIAYQFGSAGDDLVGGQLDRDSSGNLYITGLLRNPFAANDVIYNPDGNDLYLSKLDPFGNTLLQVQAGGQNAEITSSFVAADNTGNMYLTGRFFGTATFGGFTLTTAPDRLQIFFAKTNAAGQFLWAVTGGINVLAPNQTFPTCITTDGSGNIYVAGFFDGATTFGTTTLTSQGNTDLFVVKLDTNGNFIWAQSFGEDKRDTALGIGTDAQGDAYIAGFTGLPATTNSSALSSSSFIARPVNDFRGTNLVVARLNRDTGAFVYLTQAQTKRNTGLAAFDIDVMPDGNSAITGLVVGDASLGSFQLSNKPDDDRDLDCFIARLSPQGAFTAVAQSTGPGMEVGQKIRLDANGRAYVCGYFSGQAKFGNSNLTALQLVDGDQDIFVTRLNAMDEFDYAKRAGGLRSEFCQSLAVNDNGLVYVTGLFRDVTAFDGTVLVPFVSDIVGPGTPLLADTFLAILGPAFANQPPAITSGPTFTQPLNMMQPGTFGISATDPEDDPLTVDWNFGDGQVPQTGATIQHAFIFPGRYAVSATVNDFLSQGTTVVFPVVVNVVPGFGDPMTIKNARIVLNFKPGRMDTISAQIELIAPFDMLLSDRDMLFNMAGFADLVRIDARERARTSAYNVTIKSKAHKPGQIVPAGTLLSLRMTMKGDLDSRILLDGIPMLNSDQAQTETTANFALYLDEIFLDALNVQGKYKSRAGRSGTFKSTR